MSTGGRGERDVGAGTGEIWPPLKVFKLSVVKVGVSIAGVLSLRRERIRGEGEALRLRL